MKPFEYFIAKKNNCLKFLMQEPLTCWYELSWASTLIMFEGNGRLSISPTLDRFGLGHLSVEKKFFEGKHSNLSGGQFEPSSPAKQKNSIARDWNLTHLFDASLLLVWRKCGMRHRMSWSGGTAARTRPRWIWLRISAPSTGNASRDPSTSGKWRGSQGAEFQILRCLDL